MSDNHFSLQLLLYPAALQWLQATRWTTNAECLGRILSNYEVLFALWEELLQYVKETDMKSRIIGIKACIWNRLISCLVFDVRSVATTTQ